MQPLTDALNILGAVGTLFSLIALVVTIYLWARGILPVLWRLGIGLSTRKIAIFADSEFDNLKSILVDSGIFQATNIVRIDKGSLKKAEGSTLWLVDWKSFESDIGEILQLKKDSSALIIYAPPSSVKPDDMDRINRQRNAIVVNFRGRLLNDVLTSMMTTSFQSR